MFLFKYMKKQLLCCIFAVMLLLLCSNSEPFHKTRSRILDHMKENKVPSISIAVAKDGIIIWEESFGLADVEKQIQSTPHTMYHLGSLGKVYTATAIMILKERGLIDLDRPANDYLGTAKLQAFEGSVEDATIRRILNHTSGLPFFWVHLYEDELDQRPSWDEVIDQYGKLVSPPGDRFIYSNLGFGILGYIIERISGKPYHDFMKTEVFEPLGLDRSMIDTGPSEEEYIAQKYAPEGRVPYSDHICKGGGTHYVSVHDLVRFGMFHLKNHMKDQKPILSDNAIDDMQNSAESTSPISPYRIGWSTSNRYGYRIVRHGGHVVGAVSSLRLIPSENLAVAVVSNGDLANTPLICDWIFAELLPRYRIFSKIRKTRTDSKQEGKGQFNPPASLIGIWEGKVTTYIEELPVRVSVESNGEVKMKYINEEDFDNEGIRHFEGWTPQFSYNIFNASFPLNLPTPFTNRYKHSVSFHLKLRGDILSGYISANGLEPLKPHFCVPSYMQLQRIEQ